MRVSLLICAAVWMAAVHGPAAADCLEDVEAVELGALQGEQEFVIDDPTKTPAEKGRAAFDKPVANRLREAEVAAKRGNEVLCVAKFQDAMRLLSGF